MKAMFIFVLTCGATMLSPGSSLAWDYTVHRLINELAVSNLPTNFPSFVKKPENVERIAFLGGEPDRWRNTPDLMLKHVNGPDHYIDVEDLADYGLSLSQLPELRYDFIARLAVERSHDPEPWQHLNQTNNKDHTKELCGLLPWTISEYSSRLKSAFSYLKAYQEGGGTLTEIANARQNIVYLMGVMGHYVGDAAQPLHTTRHYNGWAGTNPNGYTTNRAFHSWIDGGYWEITDLPTISGLGPHLKPIEPPNLDENAFITAVEFIQAQHDLVEPLYQLEKAGDLEIDDQGTLTGRLFLEERILDAAQMLIQIWMNAWQQAPDDSFLLNRLRDDQ